MTLSTMLQSAITKRFGLRPRHDWAKSIEQAISQLADERQLPRARVERDLPDDPNLLRAVAGKLTVEETFFFRFPVQIEQVVDHVAQLLPHRPRAAVTVWSAGCASGEEPYSVAMGLHGRLGALPDNLAIVGCDISAVAIERARRGIFGNWSFRGVSEQIRQLYFESLPADKSRIAAVFRSSVRFEHLAIHEMAHRLGPTSVDVVLFRNVGVYFDEASLARCFKQYHRALAPDGLLVLAATDPTPPPELFKRVRSDSIGIYRRAEQSEVTKSRTKARTVPRPAPDPVGRRDAIRTLRPPPVVEALALGDRGQLSQAIEAADRAVAGHVDDPHGFFVRGQLLLASGQPVAAIEDFRRVLFLRADDRLARYWYIVALHGAREVGRLGPQIAELRRQLAGALEDEILEDGRTSASELRAALITFEGLCE
ncbi:MAG TPA: CheR family methyltransferase [Polyangiaceae bacterium]